MPLLVVIWEISASTRDVTMSEQGDPIHRALNHYGGAKWLRGEPKSPNNVTSTFFNRVHLLPKDLRFEQGGARLAFLHRTPQASTTLLFKNTAIDWWCEKLLDPSLRKPFPINQSTWKRVNWLSNLQNNCTPVKEKNQPHGSRLCEIKLIFVCSWSFTFIFIFGWSGFNFNGVSNFCVLVLINICNNDR